MRPFDLQHARVRHPDPPTRRHRTSRLDEGRLTHCFWVIWGMLDWSVRHALLHHAVTPLVFLEKHREACQHGREMDQTSKETDIRSEFSVREEHPT